MVMGYVGRPMGGQETQQAGHSADQPGMEVQLGFYLILFLIFPVPGGEGMDSQIGQRITLRIG